MGGAGSGGGGHAGLGNGLWTRGHPQQRPRGVKAAAWLMPLPVSLLVPMGMGACGSLTRLSPRPGPQVEPPELPEDLRHWIAYNEASSQLLRAESGLSDAVKDQ